MHDENLLENLFDSKSLRVLRLFIDDKNNEFYLREISKKSNVPVSSTFRIVAKLRYLKLVDQIKIKKFKLYKLAETDNAKFLIKILKEKEILKCETIYIYLFVHSFTDVHLKSVSNFRNLSSVLLRLNL